jgi:hypothetical protein
MFGGEHINSTEDRAVLHVATRARRDQVRRRGALWGCGGGPRGRPFGEEPEGGALRSGSAVWAPSPRPGSACQLLIAPPPGPPPRPAPSQVMKTGGKDVVPEVWEVLDKIKTFSDKVGFGGGWGWGWGGMAGGWRGDGGGMTGARGRKAGLASGPGPLAPPAAAAPPFPHTPLRLAPSLRPSPPTRPGAQRPVAGRDGQAHQARRRRRHRRQLPGAALRAHRAQVRVCVFAGGRGGARAKQGAGLILISRGGGAGAAPQHESSPLLPDPPHASSWPPFPPLPPPPPAPPGPSRAQ